MSSWGDDKGPAERRPAARRRRSRSGSGGDDHAAAIPASVAGAAVVMEGSAPATLAPVAESEHLFGCPFCLERFQAVRLVPHAATCAGLASPRTEIVQQEEETFENERLLPLAGWLPPGLPFDPPAWSDASGKAEKSCKPDDIALPLLGDWRWLGPWSADLDGEVDDEGWAYAPDWAATDWSSASAGCSVRRRRWVRLRECVTVVESASGDGGYEWPVQEERFEVDSRRLLGSSWGNTRWMDVSMQDAARVDEVQLPSARWRWLSAWRVDKTDDVDENGWMYASDGSSAEWTAAAGITSRVRRRRWVRVRVKEAMEAEEAATPKEDRCMSAGLEALAAAFVAMQNLTAAGRYVARARFDAAWRDAVLIVQQLQELLALRERKVAGRPSPAFLRMAREFHRLRRRIDSHDAVRARQKEVAEAKRARVLQRVLREEEQAKAEEAVAVELVGSAATTEEVEAAVEAERAEELLAIARDMQEIRAITTDMAALVAEHDALVAEAEAELTEASDASMAALREVGEAAKHSRRGWGAKGALITGGVLGAVGMITGPWGAAAGAAAGSALGGWIGGKLSAAKAREADAVVDSIAGAREERRAADELAAPPPPPPPPPPAARRSSSPPPPPPPPRR